MYVPNAELFFPVAAHASEGNGLLNVHRIHGSLSPRRYTIITCWVHYSTAVYTEKVTSGSLFADGAIYFASALLVSRMFWPYTCRYPHERHSNAWFVNTFGDIQWVSTWKYQKQRATELCLRFLLLLFTSLVTYALSCALFWCHIKKLIEYVKEKKLKSDDDP